MPQAPWSASAVEARAVTALLPYAGNARTHSAEQVAQIAASILEFGFVAPVLVDERGEVIAGHGRLQAAKSLGLETVPTITRAGLTDAQKAAYRLADNRIALNAGWDEALLAAEVAKLQEMGGIDLALTGFDTGELDRLLAGMEPVATDPGNGPIASPAIASGDLPGNDAPQDDPAEISQRVRERFIELMRAGLADAQSTIRPVPGVPGILGLLAERENASIAIATGGWPETARMKLDTIGVDHRVYRLCTCADHPHRHGIITRALECVDRPMEGAVYFGDGVWDARTTHRMGMAFVGVAAEPGKRERLEAEGVRVILEDFTDPEAVVGAAEEAIDRVRASA